MELTNFHDKRQYWKYEMLKIANKNKYLFKYLNILNI